MLNPQKKITSKKKFYNHPQIKKSYMNSSILILYATQTGTAQYLSECLYRELLKFQKHIRLYSIDQYDWLNLPEENTVYFLVSTTGDGVQPTSMNQFWQFLLIKDLPPDSLKNITFSVFGLGDSKYTKFNFAARKLRQRLLQLGTKAELPESVYGDEQHPCGVETEYIQWQKKIIELYRIDTEQNRIKSQVNDKPQLQLSISQDNHKICENKSYNENQFCVISKLSLTPENHSKTTLQIIFQKNQEQELGDILSVKPKNNEDLARKLSSLLGFSDPERTTLELQWNIQHYKQIIPNKISLLKLLMEELDISSPPSRYFIQLLAINVQNPLHQEKLQEMTSNTEQGLEEYYKYVQREKRNPYEILYDFQPCVFPLDQFILSINLMRSREFSISTYRKNEVGITCALVQYRTNFNRLIKGLCSFYLNSVQVGSLITAKILKGSINFPKDISTPVIMIGPGTGVAPFISYIEYREQLYQNTDQKTQPTSILFFGSCYKEKEFYYEKYLQQMVQKGQLVLFTAFSRDQKEKIYVQDIIKREEKYIGQIINSNLDSVNIFIAGTSKNMPSQVEETFKQIIGTDKLNQLKRRKQYNLECW